jgi:glutamyl-tRNA reductase
MNVLLTGINHKTAPVEMREMLAIEPGRLTDATRVLLSVPGVEEAMILSTCNRVEVLASHRANCPDLLDVLGDYLGVNTSAFRQHVYELHGIDAVQHLFRVGSSLDSMVVGEPQILGQLKEAYAAARSMGSVRTHLDKLLQTAFSVAKKVRTKTQIGSSSVSVASVAVDLAKKVFGSLEGKRVMLVGAGKMGELAVQQLLKHGADSILVTNRTHERAVRLANEFGGRAVRFEDFYTTAPQVDIVITSTGAPQHIIRPEHGKQFLQIRRHRPMFFVDIAVPRDVDPQLNRVDGLFLYDIDALQSIAASHLADRAVEAQHAEMIVAKEAIRFQRHEMALNVAPMIVELQSAAEDLRHAELRRAHSRLQSLTEEQRAAVEALTKSLINKFLHQPMRTLKTAAEEADTVALDVMRAAFNLPAVQEQAPSSVSATGEGPNYIPAHELVAGSHEKADSAAARPASTASVRCRRWPACRLPLSGLVQTDCTAVISVCRCH